MPLEFLVDYYNQRICADRLLVKPPFTWKYDHVEAQIGSQQLHSEFQPIRQTQQPSRIIGYDANVRLLNCCSDDFMYLPAKDTCQNSDYLCHTLHLLNHLLRVHEQGYLFLPITPAQLLNNDGAMLVYDENLLFRCGIQPDRVAFLIDVEACAPRSLTALLSALQQQRLRGYATALRFGSRTMTLLERKATLNVLARFVPDFVRLDSQLLLTPQEETQSRPSSQNPALPYWWLSLRSLDTQLIIDGVNDARAARQAIHAAADMVTGEYYDWIDTPAPATLM